jgi:AbrB family looped-hinge helix DNA binding protein
VALDGVVVRLLAGFGGPDIDQTHISLSHRMWWDMTSVLDDKRRVVLPKEIADELGLVEGSTVTFKTEKGVVTVKKAKEAEDSLRETMSWDPKRTRMPRPVKEDEIKEIWRRT